MGSEQRVAVRMGAAWSFPVIDQDEGQGGSQGRKAEAEAVGCSKGKTQEWYEKISTHMSK